MLQALLAHLTVFTIIMFLSACSDESGNSSNSPQANTLHNDMHEVSVQTKDINKGLLDTSKCMIEKSSKIRFSSSEKMDDLRVVVQGEPCIQGKYVISIYSNDDLLFDYKGQVNDLYVDSVGMTIAMLSNDLDSVVKEELTGTWPEYVKELSRDELLEEFGEVYRFSISKEKFEFYKKSNVPGLAITTYYDEVVHVVFDSRGKVSEVAWSSGL